MSALVHQSEGMDALGNEERAWGWMHSGMKSARGPRRKGVPSCDTFGIEKKVPIRDSTSAASRVYLKGSFKLFLYANFLDLFREQTANAKN